MQTFSVRSILQGSLRPVPGLASCDLSFHFSFSTVDPSCNVLHIPRKFNICLVLKVSKILCPQTFWRMIFSSWSKMALSEWLWLKWMTQDLSHLHLDIRCDFILPSMLGHPINKLLWANTVWYQIKWPKSEQTHHTNALLFTLSGQLRNLSHFLAIP